MTTETLKTGAITNLDSVPPLRATAGKDGHGIVARVTGYVQPQTGKTAGSLYLMARIPTTARNLRAKMGFEGTVTTLTGDLTLYYSDLSSDEVGKGIGDTGAVIAALFASAVAVGGQTVNQLVDATNESGNYGAVAREKELWDAAGLSSDPGGFFDVVFVSTATHSLTNGALLVVEVEYTAPYL